MAAYPSPLRHEMIGWPGNDARTRQVLQIPLHCASSTARKVDNHYNLQNHIPAQKNLILGLEVSIGM